MSESKNEVIKYLQYKELIDETLPKKTDEEGYVSLVKRKNNKISGPLKGKEVDIDAITHAQDLEIAKVTRDIAMYEAKEKAEKRRIISEVISGIPEGLEHFNQIINTMLEVYVVYKVDIQPTLKNRTIPWMKKQISRIIPKRITKKETAKEEPTAEDVFAQILPSPEGFLNAVNEAYSNYIFHIESEEARRIFLEILFLSAEIAQRIRYLSDSVIVPDSLKLDEDLKKQWKTVFEEITTVKMAEAVNQILNSDISLLDSPDILKQYNLLGGKAKSDRELIPLEYSSFRNAFEIENED